MGDSLEGKQQEQPQTPQQLQQQQRLRNRLLSIQHDVDTFVRPLLTSTESVGPETAKIPVIANERCGTWYAHPFTKASCYFKSADGHVGTWNFSLKRLNLPVVTRVAKSARGSCLILDASVRKQLPDSLSRTIPIWCAVMNRVVSTYRKRDFQLPDLRGWDTKLYTPSWLVSEQEHETISSLLDERVEALYQSGAIVHPRKLVDTLQKPLRPYWITPTTERMEDGGFGDDYFDTNYYAIVCVSCSTITSSPPAGSTFDYIPGAADDEESWAQHLTPALFWKHATAVTKLLESPNCSDRTILDRLMKDSDDDDVNQHPLDYSVLGDTGISIGSRRAGRPPECWEAFDAILNVTTTEYDTMTKTIPPHKYYLQLPVEEGKRDRTELEKYLAVGIAFCAFHSTKHSKILIHCAQGRDRSVAVAMAAVVLLCDPTRQPLSLRPQVKSVLTQERLRDFAGLVEKKNSSRNDDQDEEQYHASSGISNRLFQALLGRSGRDLLSKWFRHELQLDDDLPLATKETLRVAHHSIQHYREKASPTRSTMQKLNRFFMSASYENDSDVTKIPRPAAATITTSCLHKQKKRRRLNALPIDK